MESKLRCILLTWNFLFFALVTDVNTELAVQCIPSGNMTYIFTDISLDWYKASDVCKSMQGHLPYSKDMESMRALWKVIGHKKRKPYWIGLIGESNGWRHTWKWEDGTPLTISHWNPTHSSQTTSYKLCAYLHTKNIKWMDKRCSDTSAVVCVTERKSWSTWTSWSVCDCHSNTMKRSRFCQASPKLTKCHDCMSTRNLERKDCKCSSRRIQFKRCPWNNGPNNTLISSIGVSSLQDCASICFENEVCTIFVKENKKCYLFTDSAGRGRHRSPVIYSFSYGYRLANYSGH